MCLLAQAWALDTQATLDAADARLAEIRANPSAEAAPAQEELEVILLSYTRSFDLRVVFWCLLSPNRDICLILPLGVVRELTSNQPKMEKGTKFL